MRIPLLIGALAAVVPAAPAEDPFVKAKALWKRNINRPPLTFRLGAMRAMAKTKDARAIKLLAERYGSPRLPKDHERYLLARMAGEFLKDPKHAEALWQWMRKHRKDEDGWLWFNVLGAEARGKDLARIARLIRAKGNVFVRAAALEALAAAGRPEVLDLIPAMLGHPVTAESAAAVLRRRKNDLGTPEFREAALPVIALLDANQTGARTKLVIARQLARVFGVQDVTTEAVYWRRLLHYEEVKDSKGYTRAKGPRFFGIRATGARVVYLIDMSDSMTARLTSLEKSAARVRLPDLKLPWDTLGSRFDLARACLKLSLTQLSDGTRFMIVGFGGDARVFRSTKGLVRATRGNIIAAVRELDAIDPKPKTKDRPYGKLRGATNVHGAVRRAFQVRGRKLVREHEHVLGFRDGADTVFVLSDGLPTKDDFGAQDRFKGGKMTKDSETGETVERGAGSAVYYGPYRGVANLLGDVARLNLFRKVEMHCIGMGEADGKLLRGIADIGLGTYRSLGSIAKKGRVSSWWIIGPFDAKESASWADKEFPEDGVDLNKEHAFDKRKARWRRVAADKKGVLHLTRRFRPANGVAGYAYSTAHVEHDVAATLHLACDGGVRVWVNGALVHSRLEPSKLNDAAEKIDVKLRAGNNVLLVKACHGKGKWRLAARLKGAGGKDLPFIAE